MDEQVKQGGAQRAALPQPTMDCKWQGVPLFTLNYAAVVGVQALQQLDGMRCYVQIPQLAEQAVSIAVMLSYAPDRSMKAAPQILVLCIVSGILVSVAAMSLLFTMQLQSLHVVVGIESGLWLDRSLASPFSL